MMIEELLYKILIKRLPEDLCLIIIDYYKKNIIFTERNWYTLNSLYKSGRNTIHLSDMPDTCTIELLEKYIIKMHGSVSYRCCGGNGIVFKNYNIKRINKNILIDNYSQNYLILNRSNINSFPKIERKSLKNDSILNSFPKIERKFLKKKKMNDRSKKLKDYMKSFLPKIYKI